MSSEAAAGRAIDVLEHALSLIKRNHFKNETLTGKNILSWMQGKQLMTALHPSLSLLSLSICLHFIFPYISLRLPLSVSLSRCLSLSLSVSLSLCLSLSASLSLSVSLCFSVLSLMQPIPICLSIAVVSGVSLL